MIRVREETALMVKTSGAVAATAHSPNERECSGIVFSPVMVFECARKGGDGKQSIYEV